MKVSVCMCVREGESERYREVDEAEESNYRNRRHTKVLEAPFPLVKLTVHPGGTCKFMPRRSNATGFVRIHTHGD
jgi:hypothetical protein